MVGLIQLLKFPARFVYHGKTTVSVRVAYLSSKYHDLFHSALVKPFLLSLGESKMVTHMTQMSFEMVM